MANLEEARRRLENKTARGNDRPARETIAKFEEAVREDERNKTRSLRSLAKHIASHRGEEEVVGGGKPVEVITLTFYSRTWYEFVEAARNA